MKKIFFILLAIIVLAWGSGCEFSYSENKWKLHFGISM